LPSNLRRRERCHAVTTCDRIIRGHAVANCDQFKKAPLRAALAQNGAALAEGDPLRKQISDFDGRADAVRKKIVATTEGGAITGEERLREHTDQLCGAILSYEGKPGGYQLAYIDTLKRELGDVTKQFDQLLTHDLPALNESLKSKGQQPISSSPAKVGATDPIHGSGGATAASPPLPADFRICQ
jgi:hypothetical protein